MKKIFSLFCLLVFTVTHTFTSAQSPPPHSNYPVDMGPDGGYYPDPGYYPGEGYYPLQTNYPAQDYYPEHSTYPNQAYNPDQGNYPNQNYYPDNSYYPENQRGHPSESGGYPYQNNGENYDPYCSNNCGAGCMRYTPLPGCYPSAPACGRNCGLSVCAIAFAIALVAGVAALVVTLGEASHVHQPAS